MNNQWLNDLQRKMEDHEEDVPDGLWEDIKDELFSEEEENRIAGIIMPETDDVKENINRPSGTGKSLLYRIGGIAAAVAMLLFTGKILLETNPEKTNPNIADRSKLADKTQKINRKETTVPAEKETNDKIQAVGNEKYSNLGAALTGKIKTNPYFRNIFEPVTHNKRISAPDEKENLLDGLAKEDHSAVVNRPLVTENPTEKDKKDAEEISDHIQKDIPEKYADNDRARPQVRKSRKWMLSMLTGNVSSNSSEQNFPGYASMSGSPMAFSEVWISGAESNPLTEVLLANQSKEVEARIRHKVPVTFGLSMYYNLGKRWGIGTGINYTKLTSELHSGSNSNYIKGDQSVHYIGIPVQINYNVIQKGRFTGYVTGGVLAEKAVAGKLRTKYIVNDEVQDTQEERLDVKPVQFSVNSAIGLQMKIVDKIGIYAEPGIGYHFKNDSPLNTVYKEKPLNFNMKFGIRILLD